MVDHVVVLVVTLAVSVAFNLPRFGSQNLAAWLVCANLALFTERSAGASMLRDIHGWIQLLCMFCDSFFSLFFYRSQSLWLPNRFRPQWPEAAFCSEDGKDSFFTCDYFTHLDTRQLQRRVKNEADVRQGQHIRLFYRNVFSQSVDP